MKKLFLELSFAALCAALLSACSSGSGTNSEPLEISSNSSSGADLFAETFDDLPVCTVNREGAIAYVKDEKAAYACEGGDWTLDDEDSTERKSNGDTDNDGKSDSSGNKKSSASEDNSSGSEGGESSGSSEGNSSGSSEEPESSSEGASSSSEEPESSSEEASSSSEEPESSSEGASSSSEEPESSSEEASSASEEPESSGSEGVEGSSASVPGGSSDASIYNASANTLKDLRDGQTYKTITIAPEGTDYSEVWMAENLNYAYTGVPFNYIYYTSDSTSWCYDNDPANCAKYGRLYTWAAAMDSVGEWSTSGKGCGHGKDCSVASAGSATLVRGICPKGWHLPSYDEWEALIVAVDGSITEYTSSNTVGIKLRSATGWHAYSGITNEDAFGFSALPAGYRDSNGDYLDEGTYASFWSSTEGYSYAAYSMYLNFYYDNAYLGDYGKYRGFSVRCLKD